MSDLTLAMELQQKSIFDPGKETAVFVLAIDELPFVVLQLPSCSSGSCALSRAFSGSKFNAFWVPKPNVKFQLDLILSDIQISAERKERREEEDDSHLDVDGESR